MPQSKTVLRSCQQCQADFYARPVDVKRGKGLFCTRSCRSKTTTHALVIGGEGSANPNWKGGLTKSSRGYWYVAAPEHPRARNGYVKRANLVLELVLGRFLEPGEIAHHKNFDKEDDRPDNLALMTEAEHASFHASLLKKPRRARLPRQLVPWPTNEELLLLRQTRSCTEISVLLGCSREAVSRRIQQIKNTTQLTTVRVPYIVIQ